MNFEVSFSSVAGRFYQLETTESLPGIWETLAIHLAGTGGHITVSLPISAGVTRRFYRVSTGG